MKIQVTPKTYHRLTAAEGYLQLNMADHALRELESIEDPGPLEATIEFMKGEVLKSQKRYGEAVVPLKRAVELVSAPHRNRVWQSLSECYRGDGKEELADMAELMANTAQDEPAQSPPDVQVTITVHRVPRSAETDEFPEEKQYLEETEFDNEDWDDFDDADPEMN